MTATLEIPFPPSANHIWRGGGRRVYLSADYKEFLTAVALAWRASAPRDWDASRRYRVALELTPGNRRRFDVDNRIKPTLDALTKAGAWLDDSQIDEVTARKKPPEKTARAVVEIVIISENKEQKSSDERSNKERKPRRGAAKRGAVRFDL